MPAPDTENRATAHRATSFRGNDGRLRESVPTFQKPRAPRQFPAKVEEQSQFKAAERLSQVAALAFDALPKSIRRDELNLVFLRTANRSRLLRALQPVYYDQSQRHLPLNARHNLWIVSYLRDLEIVSSSVRREAFAFLSSALAQNRVILGQLENEMLGGQTPEYLYLIARHLEPEKISTVEGDFFVVSDADRVDGFHKALAHIDHSHLAIILSHPQRRQILSGLRGSTEQSRQGLMRLFAEARTAMDRFQNELRERPEDIWRYGPIVTAGVIRFIETLDWTPGQRHLLIQFMLEIARLKSRDSLGDALFVIGMLLSVAAIALSGGTFGAVILGADLIFGASAASRNAYEEYLRERQNAYAETASALQQGVPLTDRRTNFSGVYLDAAGVLISGYFLSKGTFRLLRGERVQSKIDVPGTNKNVLSKSAAQRVFAETQRAVPKLTFKASETLHQTWKERFIKRLRRRSNLADDAPVPTWFHEWADNKAKDLLQKLAATRHPELISAANRLYKVNGFDLTLEAALSTQRSRHQGARFVIRFMLTRLPENLHPQEIILELRSNVGDIIRYVDLTVRGHKFELKSIQHVTRELVAGGRGKWGQVEKDLVLLLDSGADRFNRVRRLRWVFNSERLSEPLDQEAIARRLHGWLTEEGALLHDYPEELRNELLEILREIVVLYPGNRGGQIIEF